MKKLLTVLIVTLSIASFTSCSKGSGSNAVEPPNGGNPGGGEKPDTASLTLLSVSTDSMTKGVDSVTGLWEYHFPKGEIFNLTVVRYPQLMVLKYLYGDIRLYKPDGSIAMDTAMRDGYNANYFTKPIPLSGDGKVKFTCTPDAVGIMKFGLELDGKIGGKEYKFYSDGPQIFVQ